MVFDNAQVSVKGDRLSLLLVDSQRVPLGSCFFLHLSTVEPFGGTDNVDLWRLILLMAFCIATFGESVGIIVLYFERQKKSTKKHIIILFIRAQPLTFMVFGKSKYKVLFLKSRCRLCTVFPYISVPIMPKVAVLELLYFLQLNDQNCVMYKCLG